MADYEKLGSFYLGRRHDLAAGKTRAEKILYDSRDLTTHAVCVGMTGSGKTGLCISLIEEAALDGIPVIAIDPKGDLGNLLLAFPKLMPADFKPWVDPGDAARKGISPDELAEQTAVLWREGLAQWDQDGERIRRFNQSVDKAIYTPGSAAGIPLTVIKSFAAPPQAVLDDGDAMRDRVQSTTSGVLALLGVDADPVRSREHILISNVLDSTWREGRSLDLAGLIHAIQKPPFSKVGVVDLETFYPAKERLELGMQLNNLLASPSFQSWLEGEPLDVERLLYTEAGRPRLSILSIAHLSEAERMFFVTILLSEIIAWMRSQPGTGSLRAVLYMDEVFGYFPPTANPPSKQPMLTLLKQARAYGLGVVLATQNPVDLDYKGLSNAGTWLLGRLQTERDKLRVLEGLEGASAQAGANFNRAKMEATLAGLGSRVFLMNNVHDNQPQVFHTRWAMSYLRGPLTRGQIHLLMEDTKRAHQSRRAEAAADSAASTIVIERNVLPPDERPPSDRPVLSAAIEQKFWPLGDALSSGLQLEYRPGLVGEVRMHFVKSSLEVDQWKQATVLQTIHGEFPNSLWDSAMVFEHASALSTEPEALAQYADLPSPLAQEKNYARWDDDLKDHLYRTEKLALWNCKVLDAVSKPGETEAEFRIRVTQLARERRDAEKDRIRKKYKAKLNRTEASVRKAEDFLGRQRSQFWMQIVNLLLRVVSLFFGKGRGVSASSTNRTMRERGEQSRAQQRLDEKQAELDALLADQQHDLEQLELDFEPNNLTLDKTEIPLRKSDVVVERIALVWLPWSIDAKGTAQPAY